MSDTPHPGPPPQGGRETSAPSPLAGEGRGGGNGTLDPAFVRPPEPNCADAIEEVRQELDLFDDWMDRYEQIIAWGRKLPAFPDVWADDAHRVPGCQSQVWMESATADGKLYFAGSSDAAIVSGLVALLLRVYSGRTPAEILATPPVFLKDLGLLGNLSTNRGNGIAAMALKLRERAAAA